MRTNLADYPCLSPESVKEALQMKVSAPNVIPIAGGTDVMVWMNNGNMPEGTYLSLHRLALEWRRIESVEGELRIGALSTYSDVRRHAQVAAHYPLLVESARVTGAIQIQNRGTLVGNIANGSPAADTVPVLMVYDAEVEALSATGTRRISLAEFYTGYRKNVLRSDELISAVVLPPPKFLGGRQYYRKVGTREAQAISKAVLAAACGGGEARLAWGSVAPVTLRTIRTEQAVARGASAGECCAILAEEIKPIDDIRSTSGYRLKVAQNLLREFLSQGS